MENHGLRCQALAGFMLREASTSLGMCTGMRLRCPLGPLATPQESSSSGPFVAMTGTLQMRLRLLAAWDLVLPGRTDH